MNPDKPLFVALVLMLLLAVAGCEDEVQPESHKKVAMPGSGPDLYISDVVHDGRKYVVFNQHSGGLFVLDAGPLEPEAKK